ncbi:MAG TPA: hypothetical protein VFH93_03160 [Thermoleophilia bacterium]|nr:hypothetical protein [Thermoleophilia bacterium]
MPYLRITAIAACLCILWALATPLHARQRRVWREMGPRPDGRPLPEIEEDESVRAPEAGLADQEGPVAKL